MMLWRPTARRRRRNTTIRFGEYFYVTQQTAAQAAARLMDVRRTGDLIEALPDDLRPRSLDDAYAIQSAYVDLLAEATGSQRIGYKAGATGDAPQKMLEIPEPFTGVLLSAFVHDSPAVIPADGCFHRILEVEFAFRMADDLPAAAAPYDDAAVMASVGSTILAIEVVDLRYAGAMKAGGLHVIADGGGLGHWVRGPEINGLPDIDFADYPVKLLINGEVAQDGSSANVLGNPINSLTWLANTLCARGGGLKAGDLVTTGSCTPPTPAKAGDVVVGDFGDLGRVDITFGS
jgi:2-keto-4-pentenoate hydratase